jgi:hypothetical protein
MKKSMLLIACLQIALAATSQTSSIFLIAPGTEIKLPSSEVWTAAGDYYVAPRQQMLAIAKNLERAKGCITDHHTLLLQVATLELKITDLETALAYVDTATAAIAEVEQVRETLNRLQRIDQWFRNKWKDLTAFILGIIAATEAAYIIYQTVK